MAKCLNKNVINYGKREDLCFNDIQIIRDDETRFEASFKVGKVNIMPGKEKEFNQTQINQMVEIINEVIKQTVPGIVIGILNELVIPRFEALEKDVAGIKERLGNIENCPTIKKELKR